MATSIDSSSALRSALHDDVLGQRSTLAQKFQTADPFPHLVLENFLRQDVCDRLVAEFPSFERGNARNEDGRIGKKAVFESVRELGPTFQLVDDVAKSQAFLDLIGEITGIEHLLYDPDYIGGGTHENRPGQSLDAHVDFNFHPTRGWHRRLNLIVYLNPVWEQDWGGALELHSDPWRPVGENRTKSVLPLLNRCVIFETSEVSWHGFPQITPPDSASAISRRSFAIYLYTEDRPPAQTAPAHSTVYVERPLPSTVRAGAPLTSDDHWTIQELLTRRDSHIERLLRREREFVNNLLGALRLPDVVDQHRSLENTQFDTLRWIIAREDELLRYFYDREKQFSDRLDDIRKSGRAKIPMENLQLVGDVIGYWEDQWASRSMRLEVRALQPVTTLTIAGVVPEGLRDGQELTLTIGARSWTYLSRPGGFSWKVPLHLETGATCSIRICSKHSWRPIEGGESSDGRDLAWFVSALSATGS
jgi:hypothetical protein